MDTLNGSIFQFSAEEAVEYQLESLKYNDQPRQDYGIEVMYRVITQAWKSFISLDIVLMKPSFDQADEPQSLYVLISLQASTPLKGRLTSDDSLIFDR